MIQLFQGDCLEIMPTIPMGSVDMVLCDLPYGTTQNKWDSIIPFASLWNLYERLLTPNAAIVLTSGQPFTSALIMSKPDWFKYEWIWKKDRATGHLNCRRMPMKQHENILVFSNGNASYRPIITPKPPANVRKNKTRSLTDSYGVMGLSIRENETIPPEMTYPKTILEFNVARVGESGLHPTQKPVALMEYLIKTYTNEGATVLDNCMGSGTTGVACVNTGRKFIGIEKDDSYFQIAKVRIDTTVEAKKVA